MTDFVEQEYVAEFGAFERVQIGEKRFKTFADYKTREYAIEQHFKVASIILDALDKNKKTVLEKYSPAIAQVYLIQYKNPAALFISWAIKNSYMTMKQVQSKWDKIFNVANKLAPISEFDISKYKDLWAAL